ncbi:uncharacterized protein LOC130752020 [Actinidia eriantha]|uniref:uncharacterized protein LOC130752020 n=1 Tax=Actinidia eriantha TaxID=165200 RepID=UPI0025862340|nr:uncharacterized protein LOC130752020 [Actinidia eriantha]
MGINSWSLLGRLRSVVKKVRFLLNLNVNRWRVASMIGASKRRMSFNDHPGLAACNKDLYFDSYEYSPGPGSSRGGLSRTTSCQSEDDIDKKADLFIANFYRQLKIERQVSLELRYCRGNSFESPSPS